MGFSLKWNLLIVLILMERIGKALRSPAKDTILSAIADKKVGVGFAFGLQEALDQIGAFIGPLIFTMVFYFSGKNGIAQYQSGYKLLIIPFVILMIVLTLIFCKVNKEQLIPTIKSNEYQSENLQPIFWIYAAFTLFCALGFVNFSIIGYHLKANNLMSDGNITLLYAAAMIVDAAAALLVGNNYDRLKKKTALKTGGLTTLMIIPILTVFLPFLTLSETPLLIITGMMAFGIVMGTHETIMRSAIADITPFRKRGTGYGVFNSVYGFALLSGSALMGWLYDLNQTAIIIGLVCLAEVVALLVFFKMRRMARTKGNGA
jgi:predicted MFS family arabinose efflux permease